jgi:hypothetical protein
MLASLPIHRLHYFGLSGETFDPSTETGKKIGEIPRPIIIDLIPSRAGTGRSYQLSRSHHGLTRSTISDREN